MSNFSVIKQQDTEGFTSNVKIAKPKTQTHEERFICKKCKVEHCLDSEYVAYLKTKIAKYEKRTICQKCKNLMKASKGEAQIPLRPDQEWPMNQQQAPVPAKAQTFADMAKKPVYEQPVFFPVKEVIEAKEKMSDVNDVKAWPTLPKKEQGPKKEMKKHVHVTLPFEPVVGSWADDEDC